MPTVGKVSPVAKAAKGDVVSRIVPVSDHKNDLMKINVFGRNGTGKTSFACTFPKPLLLVGFEDGTKSVNTVKGVDFVQVANTAEAHQLADSLAAGSKYVTVVLDTVTSLQDLVLMELLNLKTVPVQLAWGTVTQNQYRQRSEITKEVTRKFLDLPTKVVVLAQEKNHTERGDEGDGEIGSDMLMPFIAASMGKSACNWLCEKVEYICQTYVREQVVKHQVTVAGKPVDQERKTGKLEFCLRTSKAHPIYAAKIRTDRKIDMPDMIADPDYDKLMRAIRGEKP